MQTLTVRGIVEALGSVVLTLLLTSCLAGCAFGTHQTGNASYFVTVGTQVEIGQRTPNDEAEQQITFELDDRVWGKVPPTE